MQNILYSANANGSIMMYDRDKKHQIMLVKEDNDTTCIDINSRGKYMATVGKDHRIRLYDLTSPEIELDATYSSFSKDIEQNYKSEARVSIQLEDQAHSSRVFSIKFHKQEPDTFFTAGWDRTVKIWDRRSKSGVIDTIYGPSVCGDGIDHKVKIKY
jgi:WD40 repeat protein